MTSRLFFDFVAIKATGEMATGMTSEVGLVVVAGYGGGGVTIGAKSVDSGQSVEYDVTGYAVNWGSRTDLMEVVELARCGAIRIHSNDFR